MFSIFKDEKAFPVLMQSKESLSFTHVTESHFPARSAFGGGGIGEAAEEPQVG